MMLPKKFFLKALPFTSTLVLSGLLLGTALNTSGWTMDSEDPLFPATSPTHKQIKAGIDLVKTFGAQNHSAPGSLAIEQEKCLCNTDFTSDDMSFLPGGIVLPSGYDTDWSITNKRYLGLCVGYGGAKIALKLDQESPTVVLIGPSKVAARKEYEAYKILNAFGFVSQQNPKIITVLFNNGVEFQDVLSVSSFASLTQEATQRKTWDIKNYQAFGNIPTFSCKENYDETNYHHQLLSPLAKDIVLWRMIGTPGNTTDSLNLIFQRTGNQTICRLFLYDIYLKDATEKDDVFQRLKKEHYNQNGFIDAVKDSIASSATNNVEDLYIWISAALLPEEKAKVWGGTASDWHRKMLPIQKDIVESKWKVLKPLILETCKTEVERLAHLFTNVKNDIDD